MTMTLPPAQRALLEQFADYEHAVHGLAVATVRNHRIYLQAYLRRFRAWLVLTGRATHNPAATLPARGSARRATGCTGPVRSARSWRTPPRCAIFVDASGT